MKILTNQLPFFLFFVIIGSLIFLLSVFYTNNLDISKTIIVQPRYTELFFHNHLNLPTTFTANEQVSFAFVVHNREQKITQYFYTVFIQTDASKKILDKGNFILKDNELKIVNEKIVIPDAITSTKSKIIINLDNKNQQITLLLNKRI